MLIIIQHQPYLAAHWITENYDYPAYMWFQAATQMLSSHFFLVGLTDSTDFPSFIVVIH